MKTVSPRQIKIPSIVKAELLYGAHKSEQAKRNKDLVNTFLSIYEIIGFNDEATGIYAKIRSDLEKAGTIIGPNDLIIAATVLATGGILVTNNQNEFQRVSGLRLADWIT